MEFFFVVAFPDEEHESHIALREEEDVGEGGDGEEDDSGLSGGGGTVGEMVYWMYFMAVAKSTMPQRPRVTWDILERKTLFSPWVLSSLVPQ